MENSIFENIVNDQLHRCQDVLIVKAREYATDDRLHNFKVAADMQDISVRQAVAGMMAKHTVSIYDLCRDPSTNTAELWDEKITDHINYLLLLKAAVVEEMNNLDSSQDPDLFTIEKEN